MGIITNGPFGHAHDGVAEAYKKIREATIEAAAEKKPEERTVQESTFADKFRAKKNAEKKTERETELSSKGKQKAADKKDPKHQDRLKTARKKWLEHVQFFHKKELVEDSVTPTLATKLKGAKYGALKPQSEVGKVKKTDGSTAVT